MEAASLAVVARTASAAKRGSSAHSLTSAPRWQLLELWPRVTVAAVAVPASAVPQRRGRILVRAPMDHGLGVHVSGLASSISFLRRVNWSKCVKLRFVRWINA